MQSQPKKKIELKKIQRFKKIKNTQHTADTNADRNDRKIQY